MEIYPHEPLIIDRLDNNQWLLLKLFTYITPALAYPEYGLLLFEKDQRWYNKWREVFGCAPVVRSEYEDKINNLLKRYHSYSEEKQAAEYAAAMSNQKPDEVFDPYHEIR